MGQSAEIGTKHWMIPEDRMTGLETINYSFCGHNKLKYSTCSKAIPLRRPCKGGVWGFWIQISNGSQILDSDFKITGFWIRISDWSGFWIQNFWYSWYSNFKPLFWDSLFKQVGILDTNLKLMGFRIQIWAFRALLSWSGTKQFIHTCCDWSWLWLQTRVWTNLYFVLWKYEKIRQDVSTQQCFIYYFPDQRKMANCNNKIFLRV